MQDGIKAIFSARAAKFPEVQEVYIITGDWDLLIKLRAKDVDAVGKFVIDKLRLVRGIEKSLTCMVFETCKETTEIRIEARRSRSESIRN